MFPDAGAKWVDPEKMHLTVRFFGNVDPEKLKAVTDAHSCVSAAISPFDLAAEGAGVFPGANRPRVLWIGISSPDPLIQLKSEIDSVLEDKGFEREERTYHPHLTVARLKNSLKARDLAEEHLSLKFEPVFFKVTRIVVIESVLKPTGSEYSLIKSFELSG